MVDSIYSENLPSHENPIPHASRVENLIMSSVLSGKDYSTKTYPQDCRAQISLAFKYFCDLLNECELKAQDVVKVEMYFQDKNLRTIVNEFWEETYPDKHHRPSRHSHQTVLPDGCIFQMTFTAFSNR